MKEKLLLICPEFYDYHEYLYSAFNSKYDTTSVFVKYTDIVNKESGFKSRVIDLFSNIGNIRSNKNRNQYYIDLETKLLSFSFDLVIIITLYPFSEDFLRLLKSNNSNIRVILFLWDEVSVVPNVLEILNDIDNVYTFNYPDLSKLRNYILSGKTEIKYLPLFYIKTKAKKEGNKYNISYIGTINPDTLERLSILNKLERWCTIFNVKKYIYLKYHRSIITASFMRLLYWKLFKPDLFDYNVVVKSLLGKKSWLHSDPLSLEVVGHIQEESKCIVDIGHAARQGYCANLISAIGNGKKLITNNKFIANEPFYHKDNICIIDDDLNGLDREFLNSPNHKIDLSCLEINKWVHMLTEDGYYDEHIEKVAPSAFLTK